MNKLIKDKEENFQMTGKEEKDIWLYLYKYLCLYILPGGRLVAQKLGTSLELFEYMTLSLRLITSMWNVCSRPPSKPESQTTLIPTRVWLAM